VQRDETAGPAHPPSAVGGVHAVSGAGAHAGLGAAGSLESLSVPPSWAMTTPQTESAPVFSSAISVSATPAATVGPPRLHTFQQGLMAMMNGRGATTHTVDRNEGGKDDKSDTEAQDAERCTQDTERCVQDAAAMDGHAGASSAASTLTPFSEPPQTTNPTGQGALTGVVAQTASNATSAHTRSLAQLGSTTATVQTTDLTTVTPVEPGQTATAPSGSTITLGTGTLGTSTQMEVNSGSVTVTGASTTVKNVVGPFTINVGSTATPFTRCYEGSTLIHAGTQLTATSRPITLTKHGHSTFSVQLVSGSATLTRSGTHTAEVITPPRHITTATVGAAGASITNVKGVVTIATVTPTPRQHPQPVDAKGPNG